ncbi:SDR family oxidoreductase [Diaminobutyricibacter tongyongensis]|uniref:SDR family oxidoreductase n=1 Tax=Leifsonia tongyongensis TaxID=1268043 RepID=A0A6L9Y3H2_9MICO|nr:SDR family oxidoreductase [Diaminobutyricibacter tongyongensis]
MTDSPLSGRTALVTGAGRGIGRAIAMGLAEAGADLVLLGRTQEQLDDVTEAIRAHDGRATSVAADLSLPASLPSLLEELDYRFGQIDVLINNAGSVAPLGISGSIGLGAFRENLDLNVIAPVAFDLHFAPAMRKREWGRIVNISSGIAARPASMIGGNAYATSKAALEAHTLNLAAEFADSGVAINAFRPGSVDTAMQAWIRSQNPAKLGSDLPTRFRRSYESGTLLTAEQSAAALIPKLFTDQNGQIWTVDGKVGAAQ